MPEVVRQRTALTDDQLLATLIEAYRQEFGDEPTRYRLAVLWSVLAFEHGAGKELVPAGSRAGWNCWCWNFGNRRGIAGDAGYYVMTATERIKGKLVPVRGRWPVYSDAITGMRTWLRMMATKFRLAWVASLTGNALAYATAAKAGGYFTDTVTHYADGVRAWMRIFRQEYPPS